MMKFVWTFALLVACSSPSEPKLATGTEPESENYKRVIHELATCVDEEFASQEAQDRISIKPPVVAKPAAGDHQMWCLKSHDCTPCICTCAMGPKNPVNNVPLPTQPTPTQYPWGWLAGNGCLWCPNLPGRDQ